MTEIQDRPSRGELAILQYLAGVERTDAMDRGLQSHFGASLREIAEAVGTAKEVAAYHLYRKGPGVDRPSLVERGLVTKYGVRPITFRITAKGRKVAGS